MDHGRGRVTATMPAAAARRTNGLSPALAAIGISSALLLAAALASLAIGAVAIPPDRVVGILLGALTGTADATRESAVILDVRLPRTLLAILVGSGTAVAGAVMQGLFRNPLADPGVVGVSAGAGLAAALWFVVGAAIAAPLVPAALLPFCLPLVAFLGGLAVTLILHTLSRHGGTTSVTSLLLAGIAISAFASAGIGLLVFVASDQQLREFTFWTLGSLGGATWSKIAMVLPFAGLFILLAPRLARGLDALALGEAEAFHLGIEVERLKRIAIVGVAAAVGASVAVSGVIAFFGLAAPHLVRLAIGPAHRLLLVVTALFGGALMIAADLIARTIASPAELPLGVLTAGLGAPFMLWLLMKRRRAFVA